MKKIEGLGEAVNTFGLKLNEAGRLSFKEAYLHYLGTAKGLEGEKKMRAFKVGMAFLSANGSIELEDADFEVLSKAVKQGGAMPDVIAAQCLEKMGAEEK